MKKPNIAAIERIFYSESTAYIFQELVTAGDLLSFVLSSEGGRLDDTTTAAIIRQVLQAISFLHNKQIVHRDLKPDNIMMTSLQPGARIVLTDFGLARRVEDVIEPEVIVSSKKPIKRLFSLVGTEDYRAPEILFLDQDKEVPGYCGKSIDMWAIGIITAVLLAGTQFGLEEMMKKKNPGREIMKFAAMSSFRRIETDPHSDWRRVGKRPKDFIRRLVTVEANRITANEALNHPWFNNNHHAELFAVLYKRAVLDKWKPRPILKPITVQLDPIDLPAPKDDDSEYFPVRDGSDIQLEKEEELENSSLQTKGSFDTSPNLAEASHKRARTDITQAGAQEYPLKGPTTNATISRYFVGK
jgi:pheromone a factor receptor